MKPGNLRKRGAKSSISFHEMKEYGMILQMNWKKMTDNGGTYEKIRFKSTDVWNLFDRI